MADIAKLLSTSLSAHREALRLRREGRASDARLALLAAQRLRLEAHEADPEHTDPAWEAEERLTARGYDTHIELMRFYDRYIS